MSRYPQPPQTYAGVKRDQAARFAYDEVLTDQERRAIKDAAQPLLEVRNLGEVGLAELLYALGQAGYLEMLSEPKFPTNDRETSDNFDVDETITGKEFSADDIMTEGKFHNGTGEAGKDGE